MLPAGRIGGAAWAAEAAVPGRDNAECDAIWVCEDAPGEARRLCAPLQYRLLPFRSFSLPICAHPLVFQRIIKIFGTGFKERDSEICGFPIQVHTVLETHGHLDLAGFSHPFWKL